ncbi:MAG: hypothetical protein ACI31D_08445 [Candidatus Limisoma sp.]
MKKTDKTYPTVKKFSTGHCFLLVAFYSYNGVRLRDGFRFNPAREIHFNKILVPGKRTRNILAIDE